MKHTFKQWVIGGLVFEVLQETVKEKFVRWIMKGIDVEVVNNEEVEYGRGM